MNKLLTITAAALLALSTGVSFAEGSRDKDEGSEHADKHRFCHQWEEYLERYGETPWFEKNIEKKYSRLCKKHERRDGGDDGRREDGGRDK